MTSGTRVRDRRNEDGTYAERVWSGTDDALNKSAENSYSCHYVTRLNTLMSQYRVDKATGVKTLDWRNYSSYETNGTKPTWSSNSELKLLSKLTEALREHSFNAGVFGAEFSEALTSVVTSAISVLESYRHLRRGNFADAVRCLARVPTGKAYHLSKRNRAIIPNRKPLHHSEIADAHLAVTYAWMPLLQDIHEAMKWVESKTNQPRELRTVVRHSQPKQLVDDHANGSNYTFNVEHSVKGEIRVYLVESISTARSLGLLNPTTILWEVVPFSFVVDWFMPIGTYLDTIGFLGGLNMHYGRTLKYVSEGTRRFTRCAEATWSQWPLYCQWPHGQNCHPDYIAVSGAYYLHESKGCYRKKVWIDRTTGTKLPVPLPRLKDLDKALSLPHIQNAAALIWTGIANARR